MKSTMSQVNIIKIYTIFTQQQDTNSIQVRIDYKSGDTGTYPRVEQGAKISWSKGDEIIRSVLLLQWNYIRN